ncbi:MAG TPA: PorV/PorQ family protein, partial [Bacteroidia bacterium]|nr:PorV/PorQ family protein [Bacteroidia bacterium]
MKKTSTTVAIMTGLAFCASVIGVKAGDPSRTAQAGATELLINPWANSSGWANANSSCVQGLEAQFLNVAGTAFINKTDVMLASSDYLDGSGIHLSAFGLTQHVGEAGALSLSIMSMNFGIIPVTTFDNPDGGIGTFNPQFINIGVSYARSFSDQIYGGITTRLISESISNVSAFGIAIDAGIQYVAGSQKQVHFGISLKNVGPQMKYDGDGLAFETNLPNGSVTGNTGQMTAQQRSQGYELPALINIGAAYDFHIMGDSSMHSDHRITVAANFTSNSFTQDEEMLGVEYGFKSFFMARVGYDYQNGITQPLSQNPTQGGRLTAFTGPCAGITLQAPFGKTHNIFGITYSYRASQPYNG